MTQITSDLSIQGTSSVYQKFEHDHEVKPSDIPLSENEVPSHPTKVVNVDYFGPIYPLNYTENIKQGLALGSGLFH